ncbi:hypothetical protein VTK56DRAFT_9189 [Thermocarpiscus australiensis]
MLDDSPERPVPTFCLVYIDRGRNPAANNASPTMGDAFRPPSPAPFVVVTEAATVRERERDRVRQNTGRAVRRVC